MPIIQAVGRMSQREFLLRFKVPEHVFVAKPIPLSAKNAKSAGRACRK